MCGIAGTVGFPLSPSSRGAVEAMVDCQLHRGPDGRGLWSDDQCMLGHARLSVIDPTNAGHQPMSCAQGTVWVTYNGEIYNFKELRDTLEGLGHRFSSNTDTEVIVHGYQRWGTAVIDHLHGMFSLALWDGQRHRLLLARDRVGKKPLFYAWHQEQLWFSSELQGLLAVPALPRDVDLTSVDAYLRWGYIPAPASGFRAISKLPPGHTLVLEAGSRKAPVIERYWALPYAPKSAMTMDEAAEELRDLLTRAVAMRLVSDVPLGAFLSGGIDSSIVVGLMAQLSSEPVRTFSIGFGESEFNELPHARRIAERWSTMHTERVVLPDALEILPMLARHYGEPYADSSAVPTYYLARETRKHVTVALTGDGGDESFAGYERYWASELAERIREIPGSHGAGRFLGRLAGTGAAQRSPLGRVQRFLQAAHQPLPTRYGSWSSSPYFSEEQKERLYGPALRPLLDQIRPQVWMDRLAAEAAGLSPAEVAMAIDVASYLPYDLLVKVDIASMANSLEARSPFLDTAVMEFAARLPLSFKLRGHTGKFILRKAFPDLLPDENVNRRKMGFALPIGGWLRGPLKDLVHDTVLSPSGLQRGYFDATAVQSLAHDHMEGRADHAARLWSLLLLELWHREVVEGTPSATQVHDRS